MSTSLSRSPAHWLLRSMSRPTRSLTGVEAGEDWLHFAQWQEAGADGRWALEAVDVRSTTDEIPTQIARAQRASLRKAGLGAGRSVCALSSPALDIFPVSFHPRAGDTLESLVILNARERLSCPLEEAVLDYSVLPETVTRPEDNTVAVLIFSAPRTLAETILKRIDSAGPRAVRLLTPGCAVAPHIKGEPGTRHLVVNAGENATSIAVVQGGYVLLERVLPWGMRTLTLHIQAELNLDESQARLLLADMTGRGSQEGALLSEPLDGGTLRDTMHSMLRSPFLELAHEAASCLSFCDSYLQHRPATSCVLLGMLAAQVDLADGLEERLSIPVRGPSHGCTLPAWHDPAGARCFATAACAALWPEDEADE